MWGRLLLVAAFLAGIPSLPAVETQASPPLPLGGARTPSSHLFPQLPRGLLRGRGGGGRRGAEEDWDRRILLTGGCGFAGSVLADRLTREYPRYLVVVYDRLDECASIHNLSPTLPRSNCLLVRGDVCDRRAVEDVMQNHGIDTVLHLAGQTSVDLSFEVPPLFQRDNVEATTTLLDVCRSHEALKLFLFCSTDEVYGGVSEGLSRESDAMLPGNPYSASKAACEHLVMAFHRCYGLPVIITRTCNMYGRNQYPEKVIPRFILLAAEGQPCCIQGSGSAVRSFVYVEDAAEAFDVVMHKGVIGETYNIGTQRLVTVRELADKVTAGVLGGERPHRHVGDRVFNDCRYAVDTKKVEELGWKPRTDFEEGLRATIEWYRGLGQGHWNGEALERAVHQHGREG